MKYKVTFKSKIIEDYMKKEGLNKSQFAEKCGLSVYVLNRFLRGESHISIRYIIKLHDLLHISTDDMFIVKK